MWKPDVIRFVCTCLSDHFLVSLALGKDFGRKAIAGKYKDPLRTFGGSAQGSTQGSAQGSAQVSAMCSYYQTQPENVALSILAYTWGMCALDRLPSNDHPLRPRGKGDF